MPGNENVKLIAEFEITSDSILIIIPDSDVFQDQLKLSAQGIKASVIEINGGRRRALSVSVKDIENEGYDFLDRVKLCLCTRTTL